MKTFYAPLSVDPILVLKPCYSKVLRKDKSRYGVYVKLTKMTSFDGHITGCSRWILGICLYAQCWVVSVFILHMEQASGTRAIRTIPTPEFLDAPMKVTYRTGELAVLYCSIHNLGTKTVVWRRADDQGIITVGEMTYIPDDRFLVNHVPYKHQWNLFIKNVQPEDKGIYECQVSSKNRTLRRLISLEVEDWRNETPKIQIDGPEFVEKGERVILTCNATGIFYPPEEMDWFLDGQRVLSDSGRGVDIYKRVSISSKSITSILEVERASMEDDGVYVCRSSDLQITSKKLNVLNAGTYNVKRDTIDGKASESLSSPSQSSHSIYSKIFVLFTLTAAKFV
ncbi:hypothetical protein CHS0354_033612 [Potamilus streckersoni]|uniref:Ig-like domain-containing protein n=1 Tax=Potamilus streckersoni TaxID=2493646 RepID=A0AAE0T0D2_9BIVA|nr:hypothetical protein CHS0354_033612 [Potamilus streckersoni]